MTAPAKPAADGTLRGIALLCGAVFCFMAMNTIVRWLRLGNFPVTEIVWARYFFHLLLIMAFFPHRIRTLLVAGRKGMQVLRSILVFLATVCMFVALGEMPIADIVAIAFVTPLLLVGLSVVILREKVGLRRWSAVLVGFLGMLVIVRPGTGSLQWAVLLPIGMAFFYALYQIITRMIRGTADSLNALFYTALVGAGAASLAMPFTWQTPSLAETGLLVAIGFLGGLGHWFVIMAYERAEVSAVAPFAYTELIWATAFGFVVFGEFPDGYTFLGAGIIAGAGLYVLTRERQARKPAVLPDVAE
ncbi:MAG TPA: DMT family transporter [Alphaproteobacteria bacterium]|nr:DMT family transporter [Alphaproteobacteria bacterium]